MQLVQAVTQEMLDEYKGGEIVIENAGALTKGTVVNLRINGNLIDATIRDTSWKMGTLDKANGGKWSKKSPSSTSVLLSQEVKSLVDGILTLYPSPRETSARLTRKSH